MTTVRNRHALAGATATILALLTATPAFAETTVTAAPGLDLVLQEPEVRAPDTSLLAWRHGQLTLHQGFGLATLAAMGLTATLGLLSATGSGSDLREAHLLAGGLTAGLYVTSATLALTAPPRLELGRETGWSSSKIHQNLAWVHGAGMIGTVAFGLLFAFQGNQWEPYHEVAAIGTLGWLALSAGIIAFGE